MVLRYIKNIFVEYLTFFFLFYIFIPNQDDLFIYEYFLTAIMFVVHDMEKM